MSWIHEIDENEATDDLRNLYDEIIKKRGKLSNIMKVHSLNPDAMRKHMDLYLTIMFGKMDISREEREIIAVVVSSTNNCDYCVNHHAAALNFYWKDEQKLKDFIDDFKSIELTKKKQALVDYVFMLTKKPYEIKKTDVDNLRKNSFSDKDILNVNLIVSYFNFVNRIALGLGVEYSKEEASGYKY